MAFKNFIRGTQSYSTYYKNVAAPILRKSFTLDFSPESSNLKICVSGFYELYINGRNITKGRLAPFINNPDHLLYYDEYEVTKLLRKGKNAIAVILGNGFANQDSPRQNNNKAPWRAPMAMALTLEADGENNHFSLESDETFKVHPSPILYDMYRFGVIYDAREEIEGFASSDFDDSSWKNAELTTPPKGKVTKSTALPILDQYELKPKSIEKQEDIYYFHDSDNNPIERTHIKEGWCYDFGYCRAGVCRLKIKGDRGQKITLRHGEEKRYGKFNMNSVFTLRKGDEEYYHLFQTDTYILKGGEEEIFVPSFTYHGFQYVLVEGITKEQATEDLLTFIVFNTDIKRRSDFCCSDEIINKLYDMSIHADLSNFQHIPTDCPSREKNGWTGDMSVSAHQFLLSFDCSENLRMWMENIRYTQTEEGMLPGVVPTNDWGYTWGNGPVWDCVIINVPYYVYKFCGRTDIIEENSDMIYRYLRFIAEIKRDEKGLVEFGLGDWCQPYRHNNNSDSPLIFAASSQIYEASLKAAFLFKLINKENEEKFALKLADEMRKAIRKELIDTDSCTVIGECQTSQSVALKMGLFEKDEYDKAYKKLMEIIKRDDYTICCGMYGLRYIFHVLFENGDADTALCMITKKDAPSYRNMIDQGGTALFESLIPNGSNESRNHHFYGDIIHLFIAKLAGLNINPNMNDIHEVLIKPIIPASIDSASTSYKFESGEITVNWIKADGKVKVTVFLPEIAHGNIQLTESLARLTPGENVFYL